MEQSIHYGLEKVGLPIILTTDNPRNLCFLIDTGSTNDVLFDYVYKHFSNFFISTQENQNIMGIDGSLKSSFIVNAELHFNDIRYEAPFVVLEANDAINQIQEETGIQIHGVLGIPFLIENKCVIDFEKLIIKNLT